MKSRWWVAIAWVVTVATAAVLGATAARQTVQDPAAASSQKAAKPVLFTVKKGRVGRSLTFSATAQWPTIREVSSAASGTITSVSLRAGTPAGVGSVLFTVDLRPVFLAYGTVPAFRNLGPGDVGADVRQLQTYLATMGYNPGIIDGRYGASTVAAVKAWQDNWEQPMTGRVKAGDLLYLPRLPARMTLSDDISVGARVTPGQPVVKVLGAAPEFSIVLQPDQAELVPTSGNVTVRGPGHLWHGRIATATTSQTGELTLNLTGRAGRTLCGLACDSVPVGDPQFYSTHMIVVPARTGPRLPVSAIRTSATGNTTVTMSDGTKKRVKILAAADGRAVVRGIEVGSQVRLFG